MYSVLPSTWFPRAYHKNFILKNLDNYKMLCIFALVIYVEVNNNAKNGFN